MGLNQQLIYNLSTFLHHQHYNPWLFTFANAKFGQKRFRASLNRIECELYRTKVKYASLWSLHVLTFSTLSLSQLQRAVDKTRRLGARPPQTDYLFICLPPPSKKHDLQTTETIALITHNQSALSTDFSATILFSRFLIFNSLQHCEIITHQLKSSKSQHNLFLSNLFLHVSL